MVPGTLLVEGRWTPDHQVFNGVSHSYLCGLAYPYAVSGSVGPAGLLTLFGPAPIIDPYSCTVLGYEWTGNSTLVFVRYGGPPAPPPLAEPPPPPLAAPSGFAPAICRIGPQLFRGFNYLGPPPGCL